MDIVKFEASLEETAPPTELSPALQALWYERRGEWERAHQIAQEVASVDGAWVHAYLHRREGDDSNAGYWYGQASKPVARESLDDEWRSIATALLAQSMQSETGTPRKRP